MRDDNVDVDVDLQSLKTSMLLGRSSNGSKNHHKVSELKKHHCTFAKTLAKAEEKVSLNHC